MMSVKLDEHRPNEDAANRNRKDSPVKNDAKTEQDARATTPVDEHSVKEPTSATNLKSLPS